MFGNFSENKKVFNLKEWYNFEIIFSFFDFFFIRPTDPTFRVEGDGKRNILLGWPKLCTARAVGLCIRR